LPPDRSLPADRHFFLLYLRPQRWVAGSQFQVDLRGEGLSVMFISGAKFTTAGSGPGGRSGSERREGGSPSVHVPLVLDLTPMFEDPKADPPWPKRTIGIAGWGTISSLATVECKVLRDEPPAPPTPAPPTPPIPPPVVYAWLQPRPPPKPPPPAARRTSGDEEIVAAGAGAALLVVCVCVAGVCVCCRRRRRGASSGGRAARVNGGRKGNKPGKATRRGRERVPVEEETSDDDISVV